MQTRTVYIVEDAPLVRERVIEMLEATPGVQVAGCADRADDAIQEILTRRPDVVLLDVRLAQGSGFDVLRAVRARAPEIDVYMLSSFASDPYRHLAARLGAQGFFDKTTEIASVRAAVAASTAQAH